MDSPLFEDCQRALHRLGRWTGSGTDGAQVRQKDQQARKVIMVPTRRKLLDGRLQFGQVSEQERTGTRLQDQLSGTGNMTIRHDAQPGF